MPLYTVTLDDAPAGHMLIVERWQDQESLTAHLETQETSAFLKKWMSTVKSDVLKYDASNERSLMDQLIGIQVTNQNFEDAAAMTHNQRPRNGANDMNAGASYGYAHHSIGW
jgi:hypothetical protein